MLNALESAAIVATSVILALMILLLFRRSWHPRVQKQHNDVIGWQISFLGTTYAVIIAFMLSDVWSNYQAAEINAEMEANALVNMYRAAEGLPTQVQAVMQTLARQYAESMVHEEWPAMLKGNFSSSASQTVSQMWTAVMRTKVQTFSEQVSFQRELTDLTDMTEHRRVRQSQSRSSLPAIFWLVLIVGGVLTVLYTCLFDVEQTRMHIFQVAGVTFMISLVLVTIADVDGPYGGAVRVQPTAFTMALKTIKQQRN